ncbi:hypothetical protein SVIO_039270 [Streptomyces violaceusniger]|uniref:Uncharacterized protein n=1 Tax=Streptomyces violaceusniger TaxID=68280 RepID=A0A4D4KYP6_STRVO|nr:hypothetical protein SVIO_039270 [Streptomyces violaceusniger]
MTAVGVVGASSAICARSDRAIPAGAPYGSPVRSKSSRSMSEPGTITAVRRAAAKSPYTSATWPRPRGSKARIWRPGSSSAAYRSASGLFGSAFRSLCQAARIARVLASYRRRSGAPSRLPTTSGCRMTSAFRWTSVSRSKNRAIPAGETVAGSGSSRPAPPSEWSASHAAVPGGGPVMACSSWATVQPAVPAMTVMVSAAVIRRRA